jgi:hypothetical protein
MSALRLLALSYLASASVFVVAATLVAHPQMARDLGARADALGRAVDENVCQGLLGPREQDAVVRLTLAPFLPNDMRVLAHPHVTPPPSRLVQPPEQRLGKLDLPSAPITILPDLPAAPDDVKADAVKNDAAAKHGEVRLGDNRINPPPPPSSTAEAVTERLKAGLTSQMLQNFDLFLYVSKADKGPAAQRMYVFDKRPSGELELIHDWAASTGREREETSPRGAPTFTATPKGYYELDPDRMYRRYHSFSWNQDMPDAMFFNWERQGLQTGLAIHAASGDDINRLGSRASAGCVHLAPQNAAILFDLIRKHYRGAVPRFAYDERTQTLSNQGVFAHNRAGQLKMAEGYRVLVRIEDYGGEDVVAAMF